MAPSRPSFIAVGVQVLVALAATVVILSAVVHVTGISLNAENDSSEFYRETRQLVEQIDNTSNYVADLKDSPILQQIMGQIGVNDISSAEDNARTKFLIEYNGDADTATLGAFVPMQMASTAPQLTLIDADDSVFTWILVDIDAPDPSNPTHAPFLHYIVANINQNSSANMVAVSYYPVTPPIGNHRYVSLLFQQQSVVTPDRLNQYQAQYNGNRSNFDVAGYAKREGLVFSAMSYFFSSREF